MSRSSVGVSIGGPPLQARSYSTPKVEESVYPAIELSSLSKVYSSKWGRGHNLAVDDLDLEVRRGEIFGFLGPNGAGKTTVIKIMLGLIHATSGNVSVFGVRLEDALRKFRFGYLPEEHRFYPHLRVQRFLAYLAGLNPGSERISVNDCVGETLERFSLQSERNNRLGDLSKGLRQKVAIAASFMNDPDIIVLDEPVSGLDPIGLRELCELLTSAKDMGRTVFFSSHFLAEVEKVSDRIAIIKNGRLLACGPLDSLLEEHGKSSLEDLFLGTFEKLVE